MPPLWKVLCIVAEDDMIAGCAETAEQIEAMRAELASAYPDAKVYVYPPQGGARA